MKKSHFFLSLGLSLFIISSCISYKESPNYSNYQPRTENNINESLFSDKNSSISEENIQKILDGEISIPKELRVAILILEPNTQSYLKRKNYLSTRQLYIQRISNELTSNKRIKGITSIPSMMTGSSPSFTVIREAAVRMQADIVIVYSISEGDIMAKYRAFSTDYKAFATTQVMLMDVRTGLIPFTDVVSKEYVIPKEEKKEKKNFNEEEKLKQIQEETVMLSLEELSKNINNFLN